MLNKLKEQIKNKGLGYWICTVAAVVALVLAIVIFATYKTAFANRITGGASIAVVLLVAVAVQVVATLFSIRFVAVISVALYGISFGVTLQKIAPTVADYFNNVAFQGGNYGMCIAFAVLTLVLTLAGVVACFFAQNKKDEYLV